MQLARTLQGFDQALAEAIAANGGKGLRPPPATEVKRMLDGVADFKAPGKLVLRSERLRGELAALDQSAAEDEAAARVNGASKGSAGKGQKRPADKVAGSSAGRKGSASGVGVEAAAASGLIGSDTHKVSKKRKKQNDADTGQIRRGGRARGNEGGEPQVLNRQHVQPERPANAAGGRHPNGAGSADGKGSQVDLHAWQGSGPDSKAGPSPPPVRWDIDVAAALGIGRSAPSGRSGPGVDSVPRGVSASAATSGAWASTSFGSLPDAALPFPRPTTTDLHTQPFGRSLSAVSAGEPAHPGVRAPILPQGVPRLKIKLRVPPGSQSAPLAGPTSASGSRRSSGSGGRSARVPYDDSWYADHVGREPRREFAIADEAQVRAAEYQVSG